jgi:Fe-S cluster biogenesis protein NfuA
MQEEISFTWKSKDGSRIRVGVEPSFSHPNVCRFVSSPELYPDGAIHVPAKNSGSFSPLADRVLALGNIAEVLIAGDAVTVTAEEQADWGELAEKIALEIRAQHDSGKPAVKPDHKASLPSSDSIRKQVQDILDTAVAPAVASHGGQVDLLDVKGNNVFLEFGGGCQGCGLAHVTLKYGVEKLIREHIPEVGEIFDTTDHAGGKNPYYAPRS